MNYEPLAIAYARHRRAGAFVVEELLRGGVSRATVTGSTVPTVLEVGCGAGAYIVALVEASGCQGWGIDPSPAMLAQAPSHDRVRFCLGRAEAFPCADSLFDLIFSVNVIHHVGELAAHYREVRRVLKPQGRVCTVTDSEAMIRNRKPLAVYWPGTVAADLRRYPSVATLHEQMETAGLGKIETREIGCPFAVTDAAAYRAKAFSCLHLIDEKEFVAGLQRMERDLENGPVEGLSEFVCLWGAPSHS